MGGIGSGSWVRSGRRATVEQGLTLPVRAFRECLVTGGVGVLRWEGCGESPAATMAFRVGVGDATVNPTLRLWRANGVAPSLSISLTRTHTRWGDRWWFRCPLVRDGALCGRRCGKLYLPPDATMFGCRRCHGLTYRTAQQAHCAERVLAHLGIEPSTARVLAKCPRFLLEPTTCVVPTEEETTVFCC